MATREIVGGVVTAHMMRLGHDGQRRPSVVVKLNGEEWSGMHCICAVPPGMTPPNGSPVRVVIPPDPLQEWWFLAPRLAVAA